LSDRLSDEAALNIPRVQTETLFAEWNFDEVQVLFCQRVNGGNRNQLSGPRDGIHALGGGIGQGLAMAIGAVLAAEDRRVLCMVGDGGLMLNPGELATAVQEKADFILLLMNDKGYG
jgi:acetolactate synthase-1/2/3 large subunit